MSKAKSVVVLLALAACGGDSTEPAVGSDPFNGTWNVSNSWYIWAEVTLTQSGDSVHGMFEAIGGPISAYYQPCDREPTYDGDYCENHIAIYGELTDVSTFSGKGFEVVRLGEVRNGIGVWEDTVRARYLYRAGGSVRSNGKLDFVLAGSYANISDTMEPGVSPARLPNWPRRR